MCQYVSDKRCMKLLIVGVALELGMLLLVRTAVVAGIVEPWGRPGEEGGAWSTR